MAVFEIKRDGKVYEVEAPDMQTAARAFQQMEGGQSRDEGGFLGFTNRGIASVMGAPVDLVSAGMGAVGLPTSETPVGGSESIANVIRSIGARVAPQGQRPETVGEYAGSGLGAAAGSLLPGAGVVGLLARGGPVASGVASSMASPFVNTPVRAMAAESLAGVGSGLGEGAAETIAPDNELARVGGSLAGGIVGGMGPMAIGALGRGAYSGVESLPLAGPVARAARAVVSPAFTEQGSINRARERLGEVAGDLTAARQAIEQPPVPGMTPATQTGDRGIMALEQTLRAQDPTFDRSVIEGEATANQALRGQIDAMGDGGDIAASREFIQGRVSNIEQAINQRIADAEATAQQRIESLRPESRPAASASIVREEMENALRAARGEESALWNQVPQDVMVPIRSARQAYQAILDETPRALRDRISSRAKDFLDPTSNRRFQDEESVREVHGLYSALREEERIARAAGNLNEARITGRLAESLMDDLQSAPSLVSEGDNPLRNAIDYSRTLNETFRRGAPGRILSRDAQGGQRVPDELTLDASVGRGGIAGAVAADEVLTAARNAPNAEAAMREYLLNRFNSSVVRNGSIVPERARQWLTANAELMDRFPTLRRDIEAAANARTAAEATATRLGQRVASLRDPKVSAAAAFLRADPYEEIRAIQRMSNPRTAAAQIMRQASKDETGDAAAGIKSAFLDELTARAKSNVFDDKGFPLLSARAMEKELADRKFGGMAREILSGDEMDRLRRVISELRKFETARSARGVPEGRLLNDAPNNVLSFIARTLAARSGAKLGSGASGASLLTANFATRRMQAMLDSLTNDRAEALLRQAISGDRELFMSLLLPPSAITKAHERRLVETMIGLGANEIQGMQEENGGLRLNIYAPQQGETKGDK